MQTVTQRIYACSSSLCAILCVAPLLAFSDAVVTAAAVVSVLADVEVVDGGVGGWCFMINNNECKHTVYT